MDRKSDPPNPLQKWDESDPPRLDKKEIDPLWISGSMSPLETGRQKTFVRLRGKLTYKIQFRSVQYCAPASLTPPLFGRAGGRTADGGRTDGGRRTDGERKDRQTWKSK